MGAPSLECRAAHNNRSKRTASPPPVPRPIPLTRGPLLGFPTKEPPAGRHVIRQNENPARISQRGGVLGNPRQAISSETRFLMKGSAWKHVGTPKVPHGPSESPNPTNSRARVLCEQRRGHEHDSEDECDYAGEQSKVTNDFCHACPPGPRWLCVGWICWCRWTTGCAVGGMSDRNRAPWAFRTRDRGHLIPADPLSIH